MKLKIVAVMASVLLIASGAAMAMPGNAPDQAQDDNAQADEHAQGDDHAEDDANESDANEQAEDAGNESDAEDADETDDDADADEAADNESEDRQGPPADVPAADAADNASDGQGPPVDMPEQVPDFVSDLHEAIGNHTSGAVEGAQSLGEKISDLTPADADDNAGNAPA